MLRKILPHPLLALVLTGVWVLLVNDVTVGVVAFGLVLGILVSLYTARYWPDRPRIRSLPTIVAYGLVVLWDIVVANVQVAYWIVFKRNDELHPHWLVVPLELETPEAVTVLAGTITMTPGTVSTDIAADGSALLVHCLNTDEPDATVARIKQRYEARLKEIFG